MTRGTTIYINKSPLLKGTIAILLALLFISPLASSEPPQQSKSHTIDKTKQSKAKAKSNTLVAMDLSDTKKGLSLELIFAYPLKKSDVKKILAPKYKAITIKHARIKSQKKLTPHAFLQVENIIFSNINGALHVIFTSNFTDGGFLFKGINIIGSRLRLYIAPLNLVRDSQIGAAKSLEDKGIAGKSIEGKVAAKEAGQANPVGTKPRQLGVNSPSSPKDGSIDAPSQGKVSTQGKVDKPSPTFASTLGLKEGAATSKLGLSSGLDNRYIVIMAVCIAIIIALFFIRRYVLRDRLDLLDARLLSMTPLASKYTLLLLEVNDVQYLVLSSSSGMVVLDTFHEEERIVPRGTALEKMGFAALFSKKEASIDAPAKGSMKNLSSAELDAIYRMHEAPSQGG